MKTLILQGNSSFLINIQKIVDKVYRIYIVWTLVKEIEKRKKREKGMRLSAKGDYALRALMDLSLNYNQRLVQAKEISQHHSIPEKFLEQILRELKNSGIVTAKSGINGGYALSRPRRKSLLAKSSGYLKAALPLSGA
jgi:hypothetical protein